MRSLRKWITPPVLLVDDNEDYLITLKDYIELNDPARTVVKTNSQYAAREFVNNLLMPAIALIDYHMPKQKGLSLITELQEAAQFPMKFCLVTAEEDHQVFGRAQRIDADFFSKRPPPGGGAYNIGGLIMEKIGFLERQLKKMDGKDRDTITGAYTRNGGDNQWLTVWNRARRSKTPIACVFADLNQFKPINDDYGHKAGDAVLSAFEKALRSAIRLTDFIVRIGDEFIIVLSETDEGEAFEVLERIKASIANLKVLVTEDKSVTPSASFGVAVLTPEKMRKVLPEEEYAEYRIIELALADFDDVVEHADISQYKDKAEYREAQLQLGIKPYR